MTHQQNNTLMIYIEPTPYVLDLIRVLKQNPQYHIRVLFIEENISQNWNLDCEQDVILPKGKFKKIISLWQILSTQHYDVVHLAGWGHLLLLSTIVMAKLKKIPVVVESDTAWSPTIKYWKRWIKKIIYPMLFRAIDLFCPGGSRQAQYLKHYSVKDHRIKPVQMTVDVTRMQKQAEAFTESDRLKIRQNYGIENNSVVFLFVGRLVPEKGIMNLFAVFNKINHPHAILLIVGEGELRPTVEQTAKQNKKIRYAGRLSGQELLKVYFAIDVVVLPSLFEPWGLVINEAMAFGKPVIISDRVGCGDDLVAHTENGFVVKAESQEKLTAAIEYLSNSVEVREKMGQSSLNKIKNWTLENEASKMTTAWDTLQ